MCALRNEAADTRSHRDCSRCSQKDSTGPSPAAFRAGSARSTRPRFARAARRRPWVDASSHSRPRARFREHPLGTVSRGRADSVGVAGSWDASDPATVPGAVHAIFGRAPRHRRRGERRCLRARRRRRALRRLRRRSGCALDRASGSDSVELRAGSLGAGRRRLSAARRTGRRARAGALCPGLPALRCSHRRPVRVASALSGRHPALGAPADANAHVRSGNTSVSSPPGRSSTQRVRPSRARKASS